MPHKSLSWGTGSQTFERTESCRTEMLTVHPRTTCVSSVDRVLRVCATPSYLISFLSVHFLTFLPCPQHRRAPGCSYQIQRINTTLPGHAYAKTLFIAYLKSKLDGVLYFIRQTPTWKVPRETPAELLFGSFGSTRGEFFSWAAPPQWPFLLSLVPHPHPCWLFPYCCCAWGDVTQIGVPECKTEQLREKRPMGGLGLCSNPQGFWWCWARGIPESPSSLASLAWFGALGMSVAL